MGPKIPESAKLEKGILLSFSSTALFHTLWKHLWKQCGHALSCWVAALKHEETLANVTVSACEPSPMLWLNFAFAFIFLQGHPFRAFTLLALAPLPITVFWITLEGNVLSFCAASFSSNEEQSQLKISSSQYYPAGRTVSHPPFYPEKLKLYKFVVTQEEENTSSTASCHILPATHFYLYYNHPIFFSWTKSKHHKTYEFSFQQLADEEFLLTSNDRCIYHFKNNLAMSRIWTIHTWNMF